MDTIRSFAWRPTTTFILLGGFAAILIAILVSFIATNFEPTTRVKVGSGVYNLWLANDESSRTQGLSGVSELAVNGGLLMDFQQSGQWGIWMKDMVIPIDIVWVNNDKRVVYIKEAVSPSLGTSVILRTKDPARYVLELPSGAVKKAGIKLGQVAVFTVPEIKRVGTL